ncbi:TetR/AcrR family transcriptional regulator [Nocardia sp. NPDC050408]|uniref:TetR/AcrR family transcriptional regulator n=1 Tax=Nocardia sp. NPDC050408 TaxID=3364319 RepID=UPI0037B0B276
MPERQRKVRADARRNYEKLVVAAESAFAEQGSEASLEGIAQRAGVSIGTLYAHFPHRRALLSAVLATRNQVLFDAADTLAKDPGAALVQWVHMVVDHVASYQGLATLVADGVDDAASELHTACLRMTEICERLVADATRSGRVRAGVTGADVFAMANAAAWSREHATRNQADRLLELMLAGIFGAPDQ